MVSKWLCHTVPLSSNHEHGRQPVILMINSTQVTQHRLCRGLRRRLLFLDNTEYQTTLAGNQLHLGELSRALQVVILTVHHTDSDILITVNIAVNIVNVTIITTTVVIIIICYFRVLFAVW